MYSFITRKLAWLMFACFTAVLIGAGYLSFSRHGRVRLGGTGRKA